MSIASQISRIQGEVSTQETLIGKIALALAGKGSQDIEPENTIQRAEGSFTGDTEKGYASVELGFQPDIVMFPDFSFMTGSGTKTSTAPTVCFPEIAPEIQTVELHAKDANGKNYAFYPSRTPTGFEIESLWVQENRNDGKGLYWYVVPGFTMHYIAVKYTGSLTAAAADQGSDQGSA